MTTKTVRRTKSGRNGHSQRVTAPSKTGVLLPQRFTNDVRTEARALGLTTQEYLRLLLALSKSLRRGLLKRQNIDAKALLQLVESPIFGGLIQYVANSAGSLTNLSDTSTNSHDRTEPHQQPSRTLPESSPNQPYLQSPRSPDPRPNAPSQQAPRVYTPYGEIKPPTPGYGTQWPPPYRPGPLQQGQERQRLPVRAYLP